MIYAVSYDARLVEESVLRAETRLAAPERAAFRSERDRLYEVGPAEEREARFEELHGRWFIQLGLDGPLHRALKEQPALQERTRACRVLRARGRADQAADLANEAGSQVPTLLIHLCSESLLDGTGLERFLRRELAHAGDMLDPAFGYRRELPAHDPVLGTLLRQRYRVVWDASIDGRLVRRGLLEGSVRDARFAEFAQTFPMLGPRAESTFTAWFEGENTTHGAIVDFVLGPT